MKIYQYSLQDCTVNQYIEEEQIQTGMQLRIEGKTDKVNELLETINYETIIEGFEVETEKVKRVYIKVLPPKSNKGYSAKIEITANKVDQYLKNTCVCHYDDKRNLDVMVTVTGKDQNKVDTILDDIRIIMEDELQIHSFQFSYCPANEELINGKFESIDSANIEYEHGSMKEIKDDIKEAFKTAKKQLGLK